MLARAGVRGLVLAAAVGIRATGEREKIREQLQRNKEDERRKPFLDSGDGDPVVRGIVGRGRGDMESDAVSSQFTGGAEDLARTGVGRGAGENGDERHALVHFGEWAVE